MRIVGPEVEKVVSQGSMLGAPPRAAPAVPPAMQELFTMVGLKKVKELAGELEAILAQIEGAGQVQVSISLESDGQKTFASNDRNETRETAENGPGGTVKKISEKNTTRDLAVSGGNPLLVENRYPRVIGVLVVAEGAGSPAVCERLINATTTLLNISSHQVSVMPRRAGSE